MSRGKNTPIRIPSTVVALSDWLDILEDQRFTGSIVLHFRDGDPREVEWGRPNRAHLETSRPRVRRRNGQDALTLPPLPSHTPGR